MAAAPPPPSPATRRSAGSSALERVLLPLLVTALLVGVWIILLRVTKSKVFPSPEAVLRGVVELWRKGLLLRYAGASLLRVGAGFSLAVLLGVPLGLCMGVWRTLGVMLDPLVQALRAISPIAWIPIAIVLFGVRDQATVFLIFLAAFFPVVLAAQSAARVVPEVYLRAGRNLGLSRAQLLWRVLLPATLPELLSGLRIALGVAWLVVVAAEMLAVDSGLGYLIIDSRNAGKRYDLVVAGMLLIGLLGLLLDLLARRLERLRPVRWGFRDPS